MDQITQGEYERLEGEQRQADLEAREFFENERRQAEDLKELNLTKR